MYTLSAECISIPNNNDITPIIFDFAILKLKTICKSKITILEREFNVDLNDIGDEIIFSGFPLGTSGLLTHKGIISGFDPEKEYICIQASINKGNSGGALINNEGKIIGVLTLREGCLHKELGEIYDKILEFENQGAKNIVSAGSVEINPLEAIKYTIQTLNRNISTGIGYARNINHLNHYISRYGFK